MNKRLLSLLLALLMLVSIVPTAAFAAVGDGEFPVEAPAPEEDSSKLAGELPTAPVEAAANDPVADLAEAINWTATDASQDYPLNKLTATAGSANANANDIEGPASFALDNQAGTHWHTNYGTGTDDNPSGVANLSERRYIQFELTDPTSLIALRYLPRSTQWGNDGMITSYQVWVSSQSTVNADNKDGFDKVAEGTWAYSDTSSSATQVWQIANFTAATAETVKYVRLYGVETLTANNNHVSAAEVRLVTRDASADPNLDGNLCRPSDGVSVTATASDSETGTSFTPDKTIDGDTSSSTSRWATNNSASTPRAERTLTVDLGAQRSISIVKVFWQNPNATDYYIETSNDNTTWAEAVHRTQAPASTVDRLTFTPVTARYIRLRVAGYNASHQNADTGADDWWNVSVYEIEVYRDDDAVPVPTVAELANQLIPTYVAADGTTPAHVAYSRPGDDAIPAGYSVTVDANLEQVVGPDGTVYTPLVDTPVEIAFTVTNADGEHATTTNSVVKTLTIPGVKTANEGNPKPAVIPEIMEWYSSADQTGQKFTLTKDSRIIHRFGAEGNFDKVADELTADLNDLFDLGMTTAKNHVHDKQDYASIAKEVKPGDIVIYNVLPNGTADNLGKTAGFDHESYRMEITDHVTIFATDATGAYWATRTLLQALKLSEAENKGFTVDQGTIRDYPEFKLRGLILDVGRKPMSMDMLRQIAKNMAWYKLNDFHVHLNDNLIWLEDYYNSGENSQNDAAWNRINEQAYAAFRLESDIVPEAGGKALTAKDYAYSKEEFKAFVADSAKIGVNIVPEIDVPAHAKSIADAFPSIRLRGQSGHSWNDHLDLSPAKYDKTLETVQRLFDEYIEDGAFLGAPTADFGSDEYLNTSLYSQFQKFTHDMIVYMKEKGVTPRLWGSLGNAPGVAADVAEGVQMNIWSPGNASPNADPDTMYQAGFDLINVIGGTMYIVPGNSGTGGYGDRLNLSGIYNSWTPNAMGSGIPAGSSQMLGGCLAVWQDNIDTHAAGIDETDTFDRIFEVLPVAAVKLWGEGQEKDRNFDALQSDATKLGTAPNTNPYAKVESADDEYFNYTFEQDGSDSSANGRDLTLHGGAAVQNGLLSLSAGESYAELGIDKLGWDNQLSFKAMKLPSSGSEEVLFESDPAYGDFAIKALPGSDADHWRLGFSRELYDYEFPVDLPVGDWVQLSLVNRQEKALLSVDGDPYVSAVGKFVSDENSNTPFRGKTGITRSSLNLPLARVGSKTNAFVGYLDDLTAQPTGDVIQQRVLSLTANAPSYRNDGTPAAAVDGDPATIWHSNWGNNGNSGQGSIDLTNEADKRYIQLDLPTPATVSGLRYLPRPTGTNGTVTGYDIRVKTSGSSDYTSKKTGTWTTTLEWKEATFDETANVTSIRLYGTTAAQFMSAAEVEPIYTIPLTAQNTTLTLLTGSENWKVSGRPHLTAFRQADTEPAIFLREGADYTLTYSDAAPGEACTITLTGTGHFTGTLTTTYTVPASSSKTSIENAAVTFAEESYPLENGKAEPKPVVKLGDVTLLEGLDYTLSYADNTAVGTATVTVTGIGDYEGTTTATFTVTPEIVKKNLSNTAKTKVTLHQLTFPYDGAAITPDPVVTYDGETLVKDKDYSVSYARNNAVGKATVTVTGLAPYCEGSASTTFTIVDSSSLKDLSDVEKTKVTFTPAEYPYTGRPIVPTFTVRYDGVLLKEGTHYSVDPSNNVKGGTGVLVIRGLPDGGYVGPFVATFTITGGGTSTNSGGSSSGDSSSGGTTATSKLPDGASMTTRTDDSGAMTATVTYPNGAKVTADIPVTGPVTAVVTVPAGKDAVTVTVPTRETPTLGHIAVILHPDGTEEIVKTSMPNDSGVEVTLDASAVVQVVDNTRSFVDVPADSWAKDAITFVTSREIFNGTGNNTFSPSSDMSRAMVCTVLANLAGEDTTGGDTWYEKAVAWAVENNVSDGTIPNAIITREQLAAMLYRYAGAPECEAPLPDRFRDLDEVSDWAEQAMAWAVENDLLRGRSSLDGLDLAPKATATRAEVASVFQRYVALLK